MPQNLQAQLRLHTIDRCLQQPYRQWTWQDLAEACGEALRSNSPRARTPSRRTIQGDIALMRSGKLGYEAPIVVVQNRYYKYADASFSIHRSPLGPKDIDDLHEVLRMLKSFRHFSILQQLGGMVTRLEGFLRHQRPTDERMIVQFDQLTNAPGQEWLNQLYTLVRDRQVLKLDYQPFEEPAPWGVIVSPYLLKEYNLRWFLIGHDHQADRVHTFALDRIKAVQEYHLTLFYDNPRFQPSYWYRHLHGVSMPYDAEPERVRILVSAKRASYLRTKPLHASQEELDPIDGQACFVYFLIINFEWKRLLRSYCTDMKVLEPAHLAAELREDYRAAYAAYEGL